MPPFYTSFWKIIFGGLVWIFVRQDGKATRRGKGGRNNWRILTNIKSILIFAPFWSADNFFLMPSHKALCEINLDNWPLFKHIVEFLVWRISLNFDQILSLVAFYKKKTFWLRLLWQIPFSGLDLPGFCCLGLLSLVLHPTDVCFCSPFCFAKFPATVPLITSSLTGNKENRVIFPQV